MFQVNESKKPLFSVIIPLYNKAPYIKRAIDSVLAQTIQDFEIIVVNDGSTDGGEDIVTEYSDSRIFLINQKNSGVSVARNNGVNIANSELISFLDADDEWLPTYLDTIFELITKYPNAGIYATRSFNYFSDKKQSVQKIYGMIDNYVGILPHVFRSAAMDGYFPGYTSATVMLKQIFFEMGGFFPKAQIAEDLDLWARVSLKYQYVFTAKPLVICHVDADNKLTKDLSTILDTTPPFLESIRSYSHEWLAKNTDYSNLLLYIDSLKLSVIKRKIANGNSKLAREDLRGIHSPELILERYSLYLMSFIPTNILDVFIRVYFYGKIGLRSKINTIV